MNELLCHGHVHRSQASRMSGAIMHIPPARNQHASSADPAQSIYDKLVLTPVSLKPPVVCYFCFVGYRPECFWVGSNSYKYGLSRSLGYPDGILFFWPLVHLTNYFCRLGRYVHTTTALTEEGEHIGYTLSTTSRKWGSIPRRFPFSASRWCSACTSAAGNSRMFTSNISGDLPGRVLHHFHCFVVTKSPYMFLFPTTCCRKLVGDAALSPRLCARQCSTSFFALNERAPFLLHPDETETYRRKLVGVSPCVCVLLDCMSLHTSQVYRQCTQLLEAPVTRTSTST